jgi:hypothetical protein
MIYYVLHSFVASKIWCKTKEILWNGQYKRNKNVKFMWKQMNKNLGMSKEQHNHFNRATSRAFFMKKY